MKDLMDLLLTRRTYRKFDESKGIGREIIDNILTAARYASSAANRQPLSYVVIGKKNDVLNVFNETKWGGALPEGKGTPKEGERPVLFIAVVMNTDINPNCETDCGLAISNMTLEAWDNGIGSCIIGACNKEKISEYIGLSENQKLHTVVAFGYPKMKSSIVDLNEGDSFKYYLDENGDNVVPKRKISDVVKFL